MIGYNHLFNSQQGEHSIQTKKGRKCRYVRMFTCHSNWCYLPAASLVCMACLLVLQCRLLSTIPCHSISQSTGEKARKTKPKQPKQPKQRGTIIAVTPLEDTSSVSPVLGNNVQELPQHVPSPVPLPADTAKVPPLDQPTSVLPLPSSSASTGSAVASLTSMLPTDQRSSPLTQFYNDPMQLDSPQPSPLSLFDAHQSSPSDMDSSDSGRWDNLSQVSCSSIIVTCMSPP